MAPNNAARKPDDGSDEFAQSSSLGRAPETGAVTDLRADLSERMNKVLARQAANNTSLAREAAADAANTTPAADPHAKEDDHGHAKPAGKKKPPVPTVSNETIADLIATGTTMRDFYRKWLKGEVIRVDLARVFSDILDTLGLDGLRQGSSFYADIFGMLTGIPDHPIHKIPPNYTDLGGQILAFHPDDEDPSSYHHSVEGLMSQINEIDLQRHYSILGSPTKLAQALSTAKGRAKAKEQFDKLFGPDITDRAEFLRVSEQILTRLGCHITPGPTAGSPVGEHIGIHDLRPVHANHSLHAFVTLVREARQHITATRLAKITEPGEDIKLDKDMNKFGDTLMEHVKGNTDLAQQFLGNINLASFDKAFHSLRSAATLEESIHEEPAAVREQIGQLFNFSPKENISEADLNSFTEALIGPSPTAAAPYALDANNGGSLGLKAAITDPAMQTKFDNVRTRLNDARNLLLGAPTGGTGTRLEQLFPPRSETIRYEEFGTQLGRSVRGKSGISRLRARSAFLRGWEHEEFRDHFLTILDPTALTDALAGSKEDKARAKSLVLEFTGLKTTRVSPTMLTSKITEMGDSLRDSGGADVLAEPSLITKLGSSTTPAPANTLLGDINQVAANLTANIDAIFQEESLERNLGTTVLGASSANLEGIISKISTGMLVINYGQLNAQFTIPGAFPANIVDYKGQLARFIGANAGFTWNDANVEVLLNELDGKANKADLLFGSRVTSNKDALKNMVARIRTFVRQPYAGTTTFFEHLQTV